MLGQVARVARAATASRRLRGVARPEADRMRGRTASTASAVPQAPAPSTVMFIGARPRRS